MNATPATRGNDSRPKGKEVLEKTVVEQSFTVSAVTAASAAGATYASSIKDKRASSEMIITLPEEKSEGNDIILSNLVVCRALSH